MRISTIRASCLCWCATASGAVFATSHDTAVQHHAARSRHIQEFEAEWKNRKAKRSGAEPVEPMYTMQDAEAAMQLFRGFD